VTRTTTKEGPNKGRQFRCCAKSRFVAVWWHYLDCYEMKFISAYDFCAQRSRLQVLRVDGWRRRGVGRLQQRLHVFGRWRRGWSRRKSWLDSRGARLGLRWIWWWQGRWKRLSG
jgi:hypothetical protein